MVPRASAPDVGARGDVHRHDTLRPVMHHDPAHAADRTPFLPPGVATHERWRRRVLIAATLGFVLLGTVPVFGHHLAVLDQPLASAAWALGAVCAAMLRLLLAPVHELSHLLVGAGLGYALFDRARAWWRLRCVLRGLAGVPPIAGDRFWSAAERAGLAPERVMVVDDAPDPAFTAGWLAPRVYVARALATALGDAELTAVLAHEAAHLRRRDPLRLSALRFLACWLFWLPALRRLADDVADEAEILADDAAARGSTGPVPLALASALLALAAWGGSRGKRPMRRAPVAGTAALVAPDTLERRVLRLAGEAPRGGTRLTRGSLAGALLALAVVWLAGAMVARPLPAGAGARCAPAQDARPAAHLLCPHQLLATAPMDGCTACTAGQ